MRYSYITYRAGYKYQLVEDYEILVSIKPALNIETQFIRLNTNGLLWIGGGYAWDGPSGPALDTPDFMRGSLVHDALYQLMRQGHLSAKLHRKPADLELIRICREDGMSWMRQQWVYTGVRLGGDRAATKPRGILRAPLLQTERQEGGPLTEEH